MTLPALLYGSESWALKKREGHIQATETKCLGGIKVSRIITYMCRREDNIKMYLRKLGQLGAIRIHMVRGMVIPVTYLGA